jgi:hypothetical protein
VELHPAELSQYLAFCLKRKPGLSNFSFVSELMVAQVQEISSDRPVRRDFGCVVTCVAQLVPPVT